MNCTAIGLLNNHFHLLLRPRGPTISRIMQSLLVSHTQRYHRHYRSGGHVWQGRFKSPVIQNDEHLLAVLRYIEANPLSAALVSGPALRRSTESTPFFWAGYMVFHAGVMPHSQEPVPEEPPVLKIEPPKEEKAVPEESGPEESGQMDRPEVALPVGDPRGQGKDDPNST